MELLELFEQYSQLIAQRKPDAMRLPDSPQLYRKGYFFGQQLFVRLHGLGLQYDEDLYSGLAYLHIGFFEHGKPKGYGVRYHNNGSILADWEDDLVVSIVAVVKTDDYQYIGQVQNNSPHGKGTFFQEKIGVYIGEVDNGQAHGQGDWYQPNGIHYQGGWQRGSRSGAGRLSFPNGSYYDGEFQSGYFCGQGSYYYPDGEVYKGGFKNGMWDGFGVLDYRDGERYEGDFREGMKNGFGRYFFKHKYYEGEWADNEFEGSGWLLFTRDGTKVSGTWKSGDLHGRGRIDYPDQSYFLGQFENGNMHGEGYFYRADGSAYHGGIWENDELVEDKINQ